MDTSAVQGEQPVLGARAQQMSDQTLNLEDPSGNAALFSIGAMGLSLAI